MIKKNKSIPINILSAFIILICLFLPCVGLTNAWFTSESLIGVQIVVQVGSLKLGLYQNINGVKTKILASGEMSTGTAPNAQYVVLENGPIEPDKANSLTLTLANEDTGSASMYVRFKFEVYVHGTESDTLIESTIDGFTEQTGTQKGFKLNSDGYYYYTDVSGEPTLYEKGASEPIMTSFTIPYTNFINANGTMQLINSDTVYIKLIIDASSSEIFLN